jgi:hypothetical protein
VSLTMIKDLEKRKDKAMIRSDTDDLWTKIETLQWGFVCYICYKKWTDGRSLKR